MLILISELNQSPWWIEHTQQQSSSINIDHWLQEILRLYDIWPSIIYNLCNIIILLLFCLFICTTIQCHLGIQWDESNGSLEGFRHLGKWHLQVTSGDSDFPRVIVKPWVSGHGETLLGEVHDIYMTMQVKQNQKHNNLFYLYI